jgi:hypothetical protein
MSTNQGTREHVQTTANVSAI